MRYELRRALQVIKDECKRNNYCMGCELESFCKVSGCPFDDGIPENWEIPPEEPDDPLAYTE